MKMPPLMRRRPDVGFLDQFYLFGIRGFRLFVIWIQIWLMAIETIILIYGLVGLICGWIVEVGSYGDGVPFSFNNLFLPIPSALLIIYAFIFILIGVIGLFGNITGSGRTVLVSLILGIVLFFVDLIDEMNALSYRNFFEKFLIKISDSMNAYGLSSSHSPRIFQVSPGNYWDKLQKKGKCCGIHSFSDWASVGIGATGYFPFSCAKNDSFQNNGEVLANKWQKLDSNMVNQEGCFEAQSAIMDYQQEIGVFGVGLGMIIVLSMALGIILALTVQLDLENDGRIYGLSDFIRFWKANRTAKNTQREVDKFRDRAYRYHQDQDTRVFLYDKRPRPVITVQPQPLGIMGMKDVENSHLRTPLLYELHDEEIAKMLAEKTPEQIFYDTYWKNSKPRGQVVMKILDTGNENTYKMIQRNKPKNIA